MPLFLAGVVVFVLGAMLTVGCGFQLWRVMGGPDNGKRLSEMDRRAMPKGLRVATRAGGTVTVVGALLLLVGIFV